MTENKDWSDDKILNSLATDGQGNRGKAYGKLKLKEIDALKTVSESINRAAVSSNKLGTKIVWLNGLLLIATIVMAASAVINAYKDFF